MTWLSAMQTHQSAGAIHNSPAFLKDDSQIVSLASTCKDRDWYLTHRWVQWVLENNPHGFLSWKARILWVQSVSEVYLLVFFLKRSDWTLQIRQHVLCRSHFCESHFRCRLCIWQNSRHYILGSIVPATYLLFMFVLDLVRLLRSLLSL